MAPNKRKILEAARKFVQKGAKEKALTEYGRLLKLDPRDAKLRLEIGDAHRRWGQVDEAIAAYTKVAEQYMGEGFDARAIAVFKQIQGLDPARWASYLPLAELYQRMGLNSEAIQALQVAADGLHKDGEKREALELLRRMAMLDPTNTASRIKVADLLCQEEMNDEAVAEYEAAHAELERQGETEAAATALERIIEIDPDRISALCALGRNLVARDLAQRAEPFVKRAIEIEADETGHYELLADIYRATNRDEELTATYRTLADVHRQHGDEDLARSITQRFVPPSDLAPSFDPDSDAFGTSGDLLDETLLDEEELLEEELLEEVVMPDALADAPAPQANETPSDLDLETDPDLDAGDPAPSAASASDAPDVEEASDEPAPQGDPDQLLAEANVYLRYGKRAQAIRNLSAVLDAEPQHRVALEKLGEAHADGGDASKAVVAWVRAAELAHESGDNQALGVLRDRVAALDPEALSRLPSVAEVAEESIEEMLVAPAKGDAGDDDKIEFELDDDELEEFAEEPQTRLEAPDLAEGVDIEDLDLEEEIEIDDSDLDDALDDNDALLADSDLDAVDAAELPMQSDDDAASAAAPGDTLPQLDVGVEGDLELEVDDTGDSVSLSEAAAEISASGASASLSVTTKVHDDLEEAEFYHQQGLVEEARGIYERVLEMAPNHPLALVRMGELEAMEAGAAAPGEAVAAKGEPETPPEAEYEFGEGTSADATPVASADEGSELEWDAAAEDSVAEAAAAADDTAADDAAVGTDAAEDELLVNEDALGDAAAADQLLVSEDASDDAGAADELLVSDDAAAEDELFVSDPAAVGLDEPKVSDATAAELSLDAADEELAGSEIAASGEEPAAASFDLAAELSGFFDDDSQSASNSSTSSALTGEAEHDSFTAVFSEFKKGVSEQLEEGDFEARYDLGIAYREMGLLEDAVGEFTLAAQGATRKLECMHLLGLCTLDLGRGEEALTHLQAALDTVDPTADEATALRFDLGRAFEALGRISEAREAWEAVAAVDPSFGEVEERLATLGDTKPEAPVDDDMESFEEFFDNDDDDDVEAAAGEAEAAPGQESFADLIAEANADADTAAEPEAAATTDVAEADTDAEADAEAAPKAAPKRSRKKKKKKISFV